MDNEEGLGPRENSDSADRRGFIRVPSDFRVDYIHEGDYIISTSKDISVDGMFICTENPPPPGMHLSLIFSIGELQGVEIGCLVVWGKLNGPSKERGMGVQFVDSLPEHIKSSLMRVVHRITVLDTKEHQA